MQDWDESHGYQHVERVHLLSQRIALEQSRRSHQQFKPLIVTLAALLHDVGDHKYTDGEGETERASTFLASIAAPPDVVTAVQEIVNAVSYSKEVKDPRRVMDVLERHPELGPVQDADRLDALGATGLARLFYFSGARLRPMDDAVRHIEDKLLKLPGMMKTEVGAEMAAERVRLVHTFLESWRAESA